MNPQSAAEIAVLVIAITAFLVILTSGIVQLVSSRIESRRRVSDTKELDQAERPSLILILVHGTFARGAKWCREGSKLRIGLSNFLPQTKFVVFNWSGLNSFRARSVATDRLERSVLDVSREFPDVPICVIAHSHGGNIALGALSRAALTPVDCGLITLSTPFFHLEPDPPRGILRFNVAAVIFFITVWAVEWAFQPGDAPLIVTLHLLIGVSVAVLIHHLVVRYSIAFRRSFAPPRHASDRTLILRTASDEASLVLGMTTLVNWVVSTIYRAFYSIVDWFHDSAKKLWEIIRHRIGCLPIVFCFSIGMLMTIVGSMVFDPEQPILEQGAVAIGYSVTALVLVFLPAFALYVFVLTNFVGWGVGFIILLAIMFPLPVFVGLVSAVTLGPELLPIATFVRVVVEPTPPGKWEITYCETVGSDSMRKGNTAALLRHSRLYDDNDSIKTIANWLRANPLGH